jgi:hypothetical protein
LGDAHVIFVHLQVTRLRFAQPIKLYYFEFFFFQLFGEKFFSTMLI